MRYALLLAGILASIPAPVFGETPPGYYDEAAGLHGGELRTALHEIVDDHQRFPYTSDTIDTWDIIQMADEAPNDAGRVLDLYRNRTFAKGDHWSDSNRDGWNREHSWPKSYGFASLDDCNSAYTDVHALFASDADYNSARSNIPYDWVTGGGTMLPVDGLGFSNVTVGEFENGAFEVWPLRRGDVARAMFYMAVRYEGGISGSLCKEPDLRLTNNRSDFVWHGSSNLPVAFMGILDTLVEWHFEDSPDPRERRRHEIVFEFQGNRNPFIDHPEWVCEIWSCDGVEFPRPQLGVRLMLEEPEHTVKLFWNGVVADAIEIERDGELITTTENDGEYLDEIGATGAASYRYRICVSGGGDCSDTIEAVFSTRRRGARR